MPSDRGPFDHILGALSDGSDGIMARYEVVESLISSSLVIDMVMGRESRERGFAYLHQACGGSEVLYALCTPEC
jgi:hypothetical protein